MTNILQKPYFKTTFKSIQNWYIREVDFNEGTMGIENERNSSDENSSVR